MASIFSTTDNVPSFHSFIESVHSFLSSSPRSIPMLQFPQYPQYTSLFDDSGGMQNRGHTSSSARLMRLPTWYMTMSRTSNFSPRYSRETGGVSWSGSTCSALGIQHVGYQLRAEAFETYVHTLDNIRRLTGVSSVNNLWSIIRSSRTCTSEYDIAAGRSIPFPFTRRADDFDKGLRKSNKEEEKTSHV